MPPRRRRNRTKPEAISTDAALEAVRNGEVPQLNGSRDLGLIHVVDPHSENKEIRVKVVNLRDDPVGQMYKRGQLGNGPEADARLSAARQWQVLYELAEIGGARAIDLTIPYVDGGRFEGVDTDVRLRAADTLNRLRKALGVIGDRLVTMVLGEKLSIARVAQACGAGNFQQRVLAARFRECLDTLALELGVMNKRLTALRIKGMKTLTPEIYDISPR